MLNFECSSELMFIRKMNGKVFWMFYDNDCDCDCLEGLTRSLNSTVDAEQVIKIRFIFKQMF